jgi:cell division protease FtsH
LNILKKNSDKLSILAEYLLEKEVIFKDDLERIFGKRPFDEKEKTDEADNAPNAEKEVKKEVKSK